jgi:gliding motility-associated-like protein
VTGSTFVPGMTITMTTTDSSGNTGGCSFIINREPDTEAPIISCPSDQEVACTVSSVPDYRGLLTVTDNQDPNPVVTQDPTAGSAVVDGMTVTMTATDASGNASSCQFIVNQQEGSVEAGEDQEIVQGEEVQLNALAFIEGTFSWTPTIGLSNTSIANPLVSPDQTTTYTVVFTGDNGCIAEDSLTVSVRILPEEPEDLTKYGFSPDGDGINEYWEIYGIENYPNNTVSIYNPWGDLVFQTDGYNNTSKAFRGVANRKRKVGGDTLPEGTYFFIIKIEGDHNLKKQKGYVVLKR